MIRRPNDRWWYPTGFCEIGMSPAENAAKEAAEETGLVVGPLYLMAMIDSRRAGSAHRHIYSHLFYCRIEGGELRPNPLEALEAAFFPLERLPEPLHGVDRKWIGLAREFHFEGRRETYIRSARLTASGGSAGQWGQAVSTARWPNLVEAVATNPSIGST